MFLGLITRAFFGSRCASCRLNSGGAFLCRRCSPPAFDAQAARCPGCFTPMLEPQLCPSCSSFPLPYRLRWLWSYDGPARDLIAVMKYDPNQRAAAFIGRRIAASGIISSRDMSRLIVPVPSTRRSIKTRGFLQTAVIAQNIADSFAANSEIALNALSADPAKPNQASLAHLQRLKSAVGKFRADPKTASGRDILLVEDVATTGATLAACAFALKEAGAGDILAVAAARSATFQLFRRETVSRLSRPAPVQAS